MPVWENYIGDERENQEVFVRWVERSKTLYCQNLGWTRISQITQIVMPSRFSQDYR